LQKKIFQAP